MYQNSYINQFVQQMGNPYGLPGFPISGLSPAVQQALRLFIPSPSYCFSDTAGTTPAVQDGSVALWKEATGKSFSASQAEAGKQPKLRKGAVNLWRNSGFQGATSTTCPYNGYPQSAPAGVTRTMSSGTDAYGKYLEWSYSGTYTGAGYAYTQISCAAVPAVAGRGVVMHVGLALVAGNFSGLSPTIQFTEANAQSAYLTSIGVKSFASLTLGAAPTRFSTASSVSNASTAYVNGAIQVTIPPGPRPVNFTLRLYQPMLELGSTVSTYVETPVNGALASNGVGSWWLEFDGTQHRMDMNSAVISSGSSASFLAAAAFTNNNTSIGTVISTTGAGGQRAASTYFNSNRWFQKYSDDAAVAVEQTHNTMPSTLGSTVVGSVRLGNNLTFRASENANTLSVLKAKGSLGTITVNQTTIGHQLGSVLLNGGIYGIAWCDGVAPTDADVVKIERYIGSLAGVTI